MSNIPYVHTIFENINYNIDFSTNTILYTSNTIFYMLAYDFRFTKLTSDLPTTSSVKITSYLTGENFIFLLIPNYWVNIISIPLCILNSHITYF